MTDFEPATVENGADQGFPAAPAPEPEPEEAPSDGGSPYKSELRAQLQAAGALRRREPEAPIPAGEPLREPAAKAPEAEVGYKDALRSELAAADPLGAASAPFAEVMRQAGVDSTQLAARALHTIAEFDRDPGRGVHDLFELAMARDPNAGVQLLARALDAAGLELNAHGQIQAMGADSLVVRNARREFEKFSTARDARGQPRYPQLEAVRPQMAALLQQAMSQGRRMTLEQLYEAATRSAPAARPPRRAA